MADVLPLAIAIAASPFPVIPAILLLFTPHARRTSTAFLAGWFVGVAAATTLFVLVADIVQLADEPPTWASWTRVVLGAALLIWGIRQWLGRKKAKQQPAWMASIESAGPAKAARLALLLSAANPKILLLAAAAGLAIGTSEQSTMETSVTVLLFALVSSVSVAAPVIAYLVRGERILGPLGTVRDWLQRNNAAVMAVVFVVIGALLLAKGVTAL